MAIDAGENRINPTAKEIIVPMNANSVVRLAIKILFLIALAGLAGCNLPGAATPTNVFVFPTLTSPPPLSTPSAFPPPSTPALPSATSAPAGMRISFATGATADVEQGSLQPGQTQNYLLTAGQSQPMMVSVDSPNHDLNLAIVGQTSGNVLLSASNKWNTWEGILPSSQDYLVTVYGGATAQAYTLTVSIPARITFAQGATSKTLNGSTPEGLIIDYVIYALAGQKMALNLNVPSGMAVLSVYGFEDGQPLLRSIMNATSWTSTLPVTEDYILQIVPNGGQVVNYSLSVEIK
jgi:hypothetical protein